MNRLNIKDKADRLTVDSILADNGYTVRLTSQRRAGQKSYDYFVEYEPNPSPLDKPKAGVAE